MLVCGLDREPYVMRLTDAHSSQRPEEKKSKKALNVLRKRAFPQNTVQTIVSHFSWLRPPEMFICKCPLRFRHQLRRGPPDQTGVMISGPLEIHQRVLLTKAYRAEQGGAMPSTALGRQEEQTRSFRKSVQDKERGVHEKVPVQTLTETVKDVASQIISRIRKSFIF